MAGGGEAVVGGTSGWEDTDGLGAVDNAFDDCSLVTIASAVSLEPALKWRLVDAEPPTSIWMCLDLSMLVPSISMTCHFCTGVFILREQRQKARGSTRWIYLVGIAGEEDGAIAYAQSAFLLLSFLVDFGHRPGLDIVCCHFGGSYAIGGVNICAYRSWRLKKSKYHDN